jgi:molybdopterin-guanine dinucleotide biosynthesis protein A
MGQDKALLQLAGKPLVEHAVTKLSRICAKVSVLSSNAELAAYAPTVTDNWPGTGPLGGIEAALSDSEFAWNLIFPVDMPFMPTRMLDDWIWSTLSSRIRDFRISMLCVNAQPYPTLLLIHRDVTPYLRMELKLGHYRVLTALESAAEAIAKERAVKPERVFYQAQWDDFYSPSKLHTGKEWRKAPADYFDEFSNLNTPAEFAEAEHHPDALDT